MESEWDWQSIKIKFIYYLRNGENGYELWRIWWTICTTRIKK